MAKNIEATPVKPVKRIKANDNGNGLTAATFVHSGLRGKPSRPKGMPENEWWKVTANARVPKMLKAMKGVARLAAMEGFSEKGAARILRDAEAYLNTIREAFGNPKPNRVVKVQEKYFS